MKQKLLAVLCITAVSVGMLTGCGTDNTQKKDEAAQESQGNTAISDKDAENAESEESAEAAGFTDGEEAGASETAVLDVSKELTGIHHAEIEIKDYGTIELELDADTAPITVTNFVKLAQEGFYDGLTFHRIMDGFMMQGGDPTGTGRGGSDANIKGEFSSNGVDNGISHKKGVISMARAQDPDSASSQFFIVQSDSEFLDGEYAGFGKVTAGLDIVDAICKDAKPTDNNGTIPAEAQPVMTSVKVID